MTEAKSQNYWISPTALRITLNALSDADYMQASAASGAMIMCYMKGIDGLEYDHGHNYKRWPLRIVQTYFTSTTKKYVYIRIPRFGNNDTDVAQVVFPSERIDLYGMTEDGRQVGNASFYYIYTQGIISASEPTADGLRRRWEQDIVTGTLASDEATEAGGTGEWWEYNPITDMVKFLKKISYAEFEQLMADYLEADQTVTDLAVSRNFMSGPDGKGFRLIRNAGNDVSELEVDRATIREKMYANWLQSSDYTGEGMLDTGFRLWYENGRSKLVIDDLVARGKFSVYNLETRIMTHAGGDVCFSGAGSKLFYVEYLNDAGESLGYTTINSPWMLRDKFLLAGASGLAAWANRRKIQRQLTQAEKASVTKFRCYVFSDDGTMKTRNWWHVHDLARCQTFDHTQLKQTSEGYYSGDNVSNTVYWRRVAGIGSKPIEALGDNKIYDYFDMWNVADVSNRTFIDEQGQEQTIGFDIPAEQYTTPGYLQTSQEFPYGDWPAAGDDVVQFGNARDVDRQAVNVLQVTGGEPGLKVYHGIHDYRTDGTKWVSIGYDARPTMQRANAEIFGDCYIGERYTNDPSDGGSYVWFTTKDTATGQPRLRIKARISAQSIYGDSGNVTLEDIFTGINNQLDGKIETWRQPGDPATSWTTDTVRAKHVGDLWMDTSQNGGKKTYIYTDNGESANPRYSWVAQDVPQEVFDDIDGKAAVYDTWNAWVVDNVSQLHLRDLLVPAADITQGGVTYKRGKVYRCTSLNPITFAEIEYTDDSAFNGYISQIVSGSGASGDAATAANAARALNNALRGQTDIDGGLMLTTMLVMRKLNAGGTYTTWGGLNGAYTDGSTIAAWFGGDFVDYDALTDAQKAEGWSRYRWATSLFRMNGSGYVAGGKIRWEENGEVTVRSTNLSAQRFYLDDVEIFQIENTGTAAEPHYRIKALYDFYSVGDVSAQGASESGGGGGGGASTLGELNDVTISSSLANDQGLVYDSETHHWINKTIAQALASLTDVHVGSQTDGQVLSWDATNRYWKAVDAAAAQVQVNWSETDTSSKAFILNKPTIPTKTSQLTNDSNFATTSQIPTNNNQLTNGAGYITSSGSCASATKATQDGDGNTISSTYLKKSGGTMTGTITMKADQYGGNYALDMNNSDIVKVNSIYTADLSDNYSEGIQFKRTNGNYDSFRAADGKFYFGINNGASERIWIEPTAGSADMSLVLNGTQYRMEFMIGSGNVNRGIYGRTSGKWLLYFNASNTILNYGNVGIGTDSPSYKLHVSGSIYATGDVTAASDQRKKDFVEYAVLTAEEIANAPAVKFRWKDKRDEDVHAGTYAQYWQKVLPEVVTDKDDTLGLNYGATAVVGLVNLAREVVDLKETVKEQRKIIDEQQKIMEEQRRMLLEMKKEIELLKKGGMA